jgi:hypothetical protein
MLGAPSCKTWDCQTLAEIAWRGERSNLISSPFRKISGAKLPSSAMQSNNTTRANYSKPTY